MKLQALCACLLLMAMSIVSIFSYSRLGSRSTRSIIRSSRVIGESARGGKLSTRLYNGIASIKQPTNRDGLGKPKGYSEANLRYVIDRHTLSGLPDLNKPFLVLGIESSCDDTGAAVVRSDGTILSNVVYSQHEVHEKFGGIVPSLAMEAHKSNIDKAVTEAIAAAGLKSIQDVDAIAVTKGPGLEICLRVGCRKAQELAVEYKKPFVTVHHLEAHCLMARLAGKVIEREGEEGKGKGEGGGGAQEAQEAQAGAAGKVVVPNYDDFLSEGQKRAKRSGSKKEMQEADDEALELAIALSMQEYERSQAASAAKKSNDGHPGLVYFSPKVEYPFLALLASGGHTSIMLCSGLGEYQVLGGTLDDSLGEAFDKAARLLGLRMSGFGGAAVEAAAARSQAAASAAAATAAAATKTSNTQQQQQAPNPLNMKVPMRDKVNCDFSYAGLKNSFRVAVAKAREDAGLDPESSNAPPSSNEESKELVVLPDAAAEDLCYHFQDIAFLHVEDRVSRALDFVVGDNLVGSLGGAAAAAEGGEKRKEITALVVVGGVAANKELRKRLLKLLATRASKQDEKLQAELAASSSSSSSSSSFTPRKPIPLIFPPPALCTDNGVMAAWAGIEKLSIGISDDPVGQEVIARWPLGALLEGGSANFKKIKPVKKIPSS